MSPVSSDARLGAHVGDAQNACVSSIPAAAARARFGVRTSGDPASEESRNP
jgi:hypothetical protein